MNLSASGPKPGFQSCGRAGDCDVVFSYAMFRDLQEIQAVFTDIAAHVGFGAEKPRLRGADVERREGLLVSGSYFPVLELQPALGRLLNSNDDKLVGESRVVVLSYNYWSSRFGLDPTILNKQVIVNGQSLTIVGVAPKGFDGTTIGMRPAVFVPITMRSVLDAADRLVAPDGLLGVPVRAPAGRGSQSKPRARHSARNITRSSMMSKRRCRRT